MKIPLHLILIYFLCRIHPRPTMSDEAFCGELDKNLAAYEYAQRQIKWQQQQEIQEEEAQIQEAIWLDQQT